jgi:ribose 5-phosphate isomerase A
LTEGQRTDWADDAKRRAAEAAAAHVESGSFVGLGSGSTALHLIEILGERLSAGELHDIMGVPTSYQASSAAIRAGIQLTSLDEHPSLDISIDGVDQLDNGLQAIKGGGAALLREKVVASASKVYVLIADERKLTTCLGDGCPLPIEVLSFSLATTMKGIEGLGGKAVVRQAKWKLGPVVTDNGNFIVDADFGAMETPRKLDAGLKAIPGVLETGLFLDYAHIAYIGTKDSVIEMKRA